MNNILTKLFTVIMLMMFSMGAQADVKVLFGEDGKELQPGKDGTITLPQKEVTGGTVVITQEDQKDGTTKVYLSVAPDKDYTMAKEGPEVYAVISPNAASTRAPEVSTKLDLKSDDYKGDTQKRTYYVTIDSNLGLWVKKAEFLLNGSKAIPANSDNLYYIRSNSITDFYLCPSIGCYYGNNVDQPHLTTFKTGGDQYSIWKIVPVENETDTYYIIHYKTGRYLKSNEDFITESTKHNRKAVHLEVKPETLTDEFKFLIKGNSPTYQIYPKEYYISASGMSFNPTNGHKEYYAPEDGGDGVKGIIGLYASSDAASKWQILPVTSPSKPCATPIVKYEGDNIIISYPYSDEEITIYYTTDDTDPSTSETRLSYSSPISASHVIKVRAIATKSDYVNSDEAVLWGSARPFLIQSKECADYNLVPAVNGTNVNTSSLPGTNMQWTLQNAETSTGGVQYYYVVNSNSKKINYNSSDNSLTLNEASADANKFCIIENGYNTGGFFLIPVSQTNRVLYKIKSNADPDNCNAGLNKKWDTNLDQWIFRVCNESADQKSLFSGSPFIVSDNNETHYYHIANVGASGYYIVPPADAEGFATASNTSSDYTNNPWIFKVAASDNWLTYYYIINAASGKYMYFNPINNQTKDQGNVISMKDLLEKNAENEEKFQFIMVRSTTQDACYIVPKGYSYADASHRNFYNNRYFGLWFDQENSPILKTTWSRSSTANHIKWTFSEPTITNIYLDPVISQDENGYVSITHPTVACDFYYTVDGITDPVIPADGDDPVTPTLKYNGPFLPPLGTTKIKTKAASKADHSLTSGVVEYDLTALSEPSITFDNASNTVTISSLSGATVYYTYGSTEPADPTVDDAVSHDSSPVTFTISSKTFIKALGVKEGFTPSDIQSLVIDKVATPVVDVTSDGKIKLTSSTPGVTIYYEIGDDANSMATPTTSSTRYTVPLEDMSGKVIKAIAVKDGWITSDIGGSDSPISLQCAMPVIRRGMGGTFTITCGFPSTGYNIYYTTGSGDPNTLYEGPVSITSYPVTVKAIATADGYDNSSLAEVTITQDLAQDDGYYLIASDGDFEKFVSMANTEDGASYSYKVTDDFTVGNTVAISQPFTGIFESAAKEDGTFCTISGLRKPLFNSTLGAVIKNVMLKDVQISQSGSVGAIASVANGYTRIYNCGILPSSNKFESESSDISSSDSYCGGLVGELNGDSRVVNCFSYAKITGGTVKAGIVGYNQTASTTAVTDGKYENLKTMVVNCMFYGDITGTTGVYPVYGGSKILNTGDNGINNYNYYRSEASLTPTDYNCSWPALEENLTRFEYYRSLLNANRELCGWWVKSDVAPSTMSTTEVQAIEKDASLMAKWVLDPSIAPYPILKSAGTYPSVINVDPERRTNPDTKAWVARNPSTNQIQTNASPDIHGETLGSISVSIDAGSHHTDSDSRTITITAMDIDNNDFCYGKIQLPYYNEIFGNPDGTTWSEKYGDNYTDMVVTGWDITTSEGTTGTFSDNPITGYNFADRNCTAKDTHRTFAQGGFYYVPYGVTSITITAHWANAYYLSNTDGNYERVYFSEGSTNTDSDGSPFAPAGTRSFGNNEFGGQTINSGTITSILTDANTVNNSVYDCAIVLVGNYQYRNNIKNIADENKKPFTLMTVDLDFDNEPDYCFEWQFGGGGQGVTRAYINPVRFDFLPIVELGIAIKEDASKYLFSIGKVTPYGHFEVTETALIHMGQFEYDDQNRTEEGPVILNNGTFDQICRGSESSDNQHVNYFILGGHVKMPSFTPGAHVRKKTKSRHCAVNVLGGEFEYFYLSGNYRDDPTNEGNPHCYIDGGKLDFVASGAKEQIVGDVFWKIDHAYIGEFYGGGINANKRVKGDISITINRSKVTKFCGGPQFGDMESGKTVTTNATGTTFGVFYGAGNGGTCYSQFYSSDFTTSAPDWETIGDNVSGGMDKYIPYTYANSSQGYHAKYELEMINSSAGTMNNAVCRTYMYAAQFATTNTGAVTSTLTNCTVETNFFGGGLLGGVSGDVTSTLKGETVVRGSVYGGGYGIADLTVDVYPKGYTPPTRDANTSVITEATYPTPTTYTWTHNTEFGNTTLSTSSPAILNPNGDGENYLYTEVSLDNLGTVTGNATLNIQGNTEIFGDVFGGGDKGAVNGSTEVNIE